jgi:DNA-binding transcriptional ArsR family regulator
MEDGDLHVIESELIESEHTFRNLKLTKEVLETKRSIVRWLALTIGIINPGESRLNAVPVLDAIFNFQFVQRKDPSVQEMQEYINNSWGTINEKTLRYHLLQLKNMGLVDNKKGEYFLVLPEGGERYDEQSWASYFFESELAPIKDKVIQVIKVLKSK